ncbi:MAG: serine/threonine protein kinase [Archangium gephyra]|uniref:Serine/threonine protein kinase n=1 Tax=Archangium gephyra TaxID=48 RepID=A0A2W5VH68_9BACT|nr:MAG: serine/threonine protein kinase [Archangium gephyra]
MAEVFLARIDGPMGFAKKCVVKRILPHFNDDPRFIEMFLGEARLAAELNHPNLVQIFDFGEANGQYFLAMEYIDGPNLRVLNQSTRRMSGPMSFALAARIIALAAEGLHHAHELRDESGKLVNLVHRDISPDNVLVSRNGAVKVVDFGIAKASSQPHLTKSGMIKGKMAYMPPEQLAREPLDRRADLFALGIVLYELITGGMPFDATSEVSIIQALMSQQPLEKPTTYRLDCPPALEAIVLKCLEKDRERRYASCRELQADLETFISTQGAAVGTREVAELVETTFANEGEVTQSTAIPLSGLEATTPSGVSQERPSAPPPAPASNSTASGLSSTSLRPVTEADLAAAQAPKKNNAPLIAVGIVAVVALATAGWFATRPPTVVDTPPAPPVVTPPIATVVDAGQAEPPTVDAGTPVVVAQAPDAGAEEAEDAGTEVKPVAVKNGRLELRIRPYATVFLDDRKLGDTPLPTQSVPVGRHKLRLVNESLGKNVTLDIVINPGSNVVKHNLKE